METPVHFKSESEHDTRGREQSSKVGLQDAAYIVMALKLKNAFLINYAGDRNPCTSPNSEHQRLQKDPPSQTVTTVNDFFSLCNSLQLELISLFISLWEEENSGFTPLTHTHELLVYYMLLVLN